MNQTKETTDILMEAFDNNETGIMLWDPDDVLVYINKATQDFINSLGATISIGIKFEDFTKNLLNIKSFSEEHYQRRKTTRQLARETNTPQDFILKSPHGNWVQVKDTPISNGYILQFNTDISSQKTIESELAENKERYSATMEALSGFAYEWDAIKDEILFSEDVQNLNLPKKLISSKTSKEVLELMHPDDIDEYLLNIKKHFKNENQTIVSEYRIPSDDGKWLWFLQRGRGIRNESGRVTKMYGLIQNFHEEKTRNEELKKSELRLDDILENVSNTIVIWDGDKKLSKINSAGRDIWKKVFGVEDRVGMDFKEFSLQAMKKGFFQIPENEDINEWADKEFDHQFNRVEQQFEIEGDDGSWYRGQRSRLKDGGYISIGSDITELKKHEKELEEQKELYSFLIDSINGVVFDWDLETQKVEYSINPNHESIASQLLN